MTPRVPPGVFFAIFTLSGLAGLIYQSIWSQYLRLFLGHAAYAQTLVLAMFMGGMAIGAWIVSRYTRRIANLLLGYALAELGIGLLAAAFDPAYRAATGWAFGTALPALGGFGADVLKWSLASALILPASILLGATFPLMSGGVMRLYPHAGAHALPMLYFTNSLGAAVGVLASGFYLVDRFGLPGTILAAGAMNVILGAIVLPLARGRGAVPEAPAPADAGQAAGSRRLAGILLAVAFATGAASFIYEIAWIRMLSLALGASTHAFEVMLAAFILGMACGAFWLRNRLGSLRQDLGWLAGVLLAKALAAVLALWAYAGALELIRWAMQAAARNDAGYTFVTLVGLIASFAVMFPAAFCAGMTLPLATHALTRRGRGERAIGQVYGANTAGCILGAIFATHVGMEALGVKGLTGAGAVLDGAAAVMLLLAATASVATRFAAGAVAASLAAGVAAFVTAPLDLLRMASGVFRYADFLAPGQGRLLYHRDGKTATISVVEIDGVATIRTNGKPDAGVRLDAARPASEDEATLMLLAALPLAIKPDAGLVANIGFGSGVTTHALLASPRVQRVDTIEIERVVVDAARHFRPHNARAYDDPRSRVHYEDAKTFFAGTDARYDIIVSEPSNPWVSGVSTLFSEEFYGQLKHRLQPDGVLVQWIHAYELDLDLLSTIFKALGKHFPDYAVYAWNPGDLYVVATLRPGLAPLGDGVFAFPLAAKELSRLGIAGVHDLKALRIGGRRVLEPLFEQSRLPANSDYHPLLDQRAPRARFRKDNVFQLRAMRDSLEPALAMLDGEERTPRSRVAAGTQPQTPRVARAAAALEALRIFSGASADGLATATQGSASLHAVAARGLLASCKGEQATLLGAVTELAAASSPFLPADEVDVVFNRVRLSPCWGDLDEIARRRIALLRAINRREAEAMAEHAVFLLRNALAPSEQEYTHYLIAGLVGFLALGREDLATRLANRYAPGLSTRERQRLLVRLTGANVRARGAVPRN
jgi:spermidine synthase